MDFDTMNAGDDLDQMVWDKIMQAERPPGSIQMGNDGYGWEPSTKIRHAWEVVEVMTAKGHTFELFFAGPSGWGVAMGKLPDAFGSLRSTKAATAPLAICRAALKAMG